MIASTRLLYAALLVAAALAVGASANGSCNIVMCTSCLQRRCVDCADGYYVTGGVCVSCQSDNCRSCSLAGRCTSCNDGYGLASKASNANSTAHPTHGYCKVTKAPVACSDPLCTSCLAGRCLACKTGYYAKDGACASCEAPHCNKCLDKGQCIACAWGYSLAGVSSTAGGSSTREYGKCVTAVSFASTGATTYGLDTCSNAASFSGAGVALVAAGLTMLASLVV